MSSDGPRLALLDDLIERYGESALVTVDPVRDEDGVRVRWVLAIDGADIEGVDVTVEIDPDLPRWLVASLVRGDESVEIERWATSLRDTEPPHLVRSLGDLR